MARVTETEVRAIIQTELTPLTSFINTAHVMVNANLANAGLAPAILKEIELYLAAHYVSLSDPTTRLTSQKLGDGSDSYMNTGGIGLNFTQYGQQAINLDGTGTLGNLGKGRARFEVVSL